MLYGPTVNLNGASRESLTEQYVAVVMAAQALIEAMDKAFPHGRDYQTAPTNQYESDRNEFHARIVQVNDIRREWMRIAEKLATGG